LLKFLVKFSEAGNFPRSRIAKTTLKVNLNFIPAKKIKATDPLDISILLRLIRLREVTVLFNIT